MKNSLKVVLKQGFGNNAKAKNNSKSSIKENINLKTASLRRFLNTII